MKLKTITFAIIATLLVSSCMKEGDFNELKHPIIFEGDFDPVLGIPFAKMSANMGDIVKLFDSTETASVYIDSNDLVSIRYSDYMHELFDYTVQKGRRAGSRTLSEENDTLWVTHLLEGTLDIPFFRKLMIATNHDIHMEGMYFTVTSIVKGYTTDTMQSIFNHGIKLYFDSITLKIDCQDGFSPVIPFSNTPSAVDETELMHGKKLEILDQFDISPIVNRHPENVSYTIRMRIAIPVGQWTTDDPIEYLNQIGVDSVTADIHAHADFPLQMHCDDAIYMDTADIEWNLNDFDSVLNEVDRHMTLDTTSCIVLQAKNYIPMSVHINAMLLDSNNNVLTRQILQKDSVVYGAPICPSEILPSYVSNGYTKSRIVVPIDMQLLHNLRKTRKLRYLIGLNSSTLSNGGGRPTISIREFDKLELKAYIVVAPHIHIATQPVEIIK